jgi:hypothetical protein
VRRRVTKYSLQSTVKIFQTLFQSPSAGSLRLSTLMLAYFSTLKGIFHPGQQGFLLYQTILCCHNYFIYLSYINYHILHYIFSHFSIESTTYTCLGLGPPPPPPSTACMCSHPLGLVQGSWSAVFGVRRVGERVE